MRIDRAAGFASQAPEPVDLPTVATTLLDARDPRLRALARMRPGRVYADVARCYGLMVASFALLAWSDSWWAMALAFVVIGTQQYALAVIEHDGKHGNLKPQRAANDAFTTWALCAPIGLDANFSRKVADHNGHHRLLGRPSDPERGLYTAEDKATRQDWLLYLSGLSTLPAAVGNSLRYGLNREAAPVGRQVDALWPTLLMQAAIFMIISLTGTWWHYIVFWLAPIYPLVFATRKIRAFCEHAQIRVPDAAADGDRLVTFVANPIERLFFAPMMMGYHAEHHLWPFVPYYNLPALHRLVGATPRIEVRRSYLGFLRDYARQLPLSLPAPAASAPG
jgi:fatty acid desaturase